MFAITALKSIRTLKHGASLAMRTSRIARIQQVQMLSAANRFAFSEKPIAAEVESNAEDQKPKKKAAGSEGSTMTDEQALEKIKKWVSENKVCLFMKGDPKEPMCGFSNFVVQTLKFYKIKEYKSIDVLKYEVIRKQAKQYSNWPTFPQLYVDGKLIGGSDIVSEMHKDGSLSELFRENNLVDQ